MALRMRADFLRGDLTSCEKILDQRVITSQESKFLATVQISPAVPDMTDHEL